MNNEPTADRLSTLRQHPELITRDEVFSMLAIMESEPVAQATLKRLAVILHGSEVDLNLLTVTAQSLVDRCKSGIETAAQWVDQQREKYDSEYGRWDNDTGAFEFGNDAQREYSDTLAEIVEGIRALHQSLKNPVVSNEPSN